jgi:hypothetical protein
MVGLTPFINLICDTHNTTFDITDDVTSDWADGGEQLGSVHLLIAVLTDLFSHE